MRYTSVTTKVASVSDIQGQRLKTTLNRMKSFETLQEQAEKNLSDYKDLKWSVLQMITVGEKIVAGDKAMAGQFW